MVEASSSSGVDAANPGDWKRSKASDAAIRRIKKRDDMNCLREEQEHTLSQAKGMSRCFQRVGTGSIWLQRLTEVGLRVRDGGVYNSGFS